MSELSIEDWMAILFFIVLCTWGIATFLFRRISINHIEREMAKEGIDPPVWDKGIGGRIIMYSMVIVANKEAKYSPIADEAILRFTRKKDKKLAWFYFIVTLITFVLMFTVAYLYGPKS
jgi:hypothetical protein